MTDDNKDVVIGTNVASNKIREYNKMEYDELKATPSSNKFKQDIFGNIPVDVTVILGKSQVDLKKVMELSRGDIVEIDKRAGESVDLVVNGQLIAQGEVVAVGDNYGVKVTKVIIK